MTNPDEVVNNISNQMVILTKYFDSKEVKDFVTAAAKIAALYYNSLIAEDVPVEAAAQMAANYKPMPSD